jgi:hypothetical protein
MNPLRTITTLLCVAFCSHAFAEVQDIDKELPALTEKLAVKVKEQGKKKVAVVDFTDLEGSSQGELGKYIAEELSVDLVMIKRDFSVLDRANLNRILAEHKLTSKGLVDPDNAKKLGQFAGVDALILGTIIPRGKTSISLNAEIITTDTAEIVGAAKAEFKMDETVQQLIAHPSTEAVAKDSTDNLPTQHAPKLVKSFGEKGWRIEVQSLRIVNGNEYLLTVNFVNQNSNVVGWIALNSDQRFGTWHMKSTVFDPEGYEFAATGHDISGIGFGYWGNGFTGDATRCSPHDTISATIKYSSPPGRGAKPGPCRIKLSFLSLGQDGYGKFRTSIEHTILGEIKTE